MQLFFARTTNKPYNETSAKIFIDYVNMSKNGDLKIREKKSIEAARNRFHLKHTLSEFEICLVILRGKKMLINAIAHNSIGELIKLLWGVKEAAYRKYPIRTIFLP